MNNKEMLYKLNTIINYLKKNGGYKHKLYNQCCPNYGYPDSNIVEYAEDIKRELFNEEDYTLMVINDICTVIKDNLKLLLLNDYELLKLKEYCSLKTKENDKSPMPYETLVLLLREAILCIMTNDLYDFRELE